MVHAQGSAGLLPPDLLNREPDLKINIHAATTLQANACSVQFNPEVSHLLAVGTAGCKALVFDLRSPAQPLAVMQGRHSCALWVLGAVSPSLAEPPH